MQDSIRWWSSSAAALVLALLLLAGPIAARDQKRQLPPPERAKLLRGILDRTAVLAAQGKSPAVAFDIDDTILLTAPRSRFLLLEYARVHAEAHPELKAKFESLVPGQMRHGILDNITLAGVTDKALKKEIRLWWLPKFLSNDYLTHDVPLPGALDYIRELARKGSTIYYVTARGPKMRPGTQSSLAHFGFPLDGKKCVLVMNEDGAARAPEYKHKAVKKLAEKHEFTGLFENEPENLNAMALAAPKAQAVFIDTVYTAGSSPVAAGVPWVDGYLLESAKPRASGNRAPASR